MSDFSNIKIAYRFPPTTFWLGTLTCTELPSPLQWFTDDPTDTTLDWFVQGAMVRYQWIQTIVTEFTDPDSWGPIDRKPPTSRSEARSKANQIKLVDRPAVMGTEDGDMTPWELVGVTMKLKEPGVFRIEFKLVAYSYPILTAANFLKHKRLKAQYLPET